MFRSKRSRIMAYLQTAAAAPFTDLLSDWISGEMEQKLRSMELRKQDFHIDWLPDYKCINIQARFRELYVDIQIEPQAFTLAADPDEPDEAVEFPLESAPGFYAQVLAYLQSMSA